MQTPVHIIFGEENESIPERRLLLAILQRALWDLHSGEKKQKESAREWLTQKKPKNPRTNIFYFEDIKEIFAFCPSRLKYIQDLITKNK